MPDLRLVPVIDGAASQEIMTLDWLQTPVGLLDETNELTTAVIVALCSDALAPTNADLPDPRSTDRRGWWGDFNTDVIWGGWPIGSLLWLMKRSKIVGPGAREGATTVRIQQYCQACLQPFVQARLCSKVVVVVNQKSPQSIFAKVTLYRGPKTSIALEFQAVWQELFPLSNF